MDFIIFVVRFLFSLYYCLLALRAILPWLPPTIASKMVIALTEPLVGPIRKGLPPQRYGMDVSPFVMITLLWVLQQLILLVFK